MSGLITLDSNLLVFFPTSLKHHLHCIFSNVLSIYTSRYRERVRYLEKFYLYLVLAIEEYYAITHMLARTTFNAFSFAAFWKVS